MKIRNFNAVNTGNSIYYYEDFHEISCSLQVIEDPTIGIYQGFFSNIFRCSYPTEHLAEVLLLLNR